MIPSLFIAHGTPLLAIEHNDYTECLKEYARNNPKPKAIIIFSSNWTREDQAVTAGKRNSMIHDFAGAPDQLYEIEYRPPGDVELSDAILTSLSKIGVFPVLDESRPLDHGAWIPLKIMYPDADIPVVELSVSPELPLNTQYEIGKSLAGLRKEGVLIVGSGGTVHNMEEWREDLSVAEGWAVDFESWLEEKIITWDTEALFEFEGLAPFAATAVPSKSYFVPFIIAMGAGDCRRQPKLLHRSYQYGNLSLCAWEF